LGITLAEAGMRSQAIEQFEAALKLDPGGAAAYNLALAYFYERRFSDSERIASAAVERQGTEELFHLLGALKEQTGNVQEARRFFSQAAAANPMNSDYQVHLGQLALASADYAGANGHFRAAAANCRGEQCIAALIGLGTSEKLRGNYEAALEIFERVTQMEPGNYLGFLYLGDTLLRAKRGEQAITSFRKAAGLKPDSALAHYMCAYALLENGEAGASEAVRHLTQTLRLDPANGLAYFRLGLLRRKAGEFAEAVLLLENAVKLEPKLKQAYYQLGLTYRSLGDEVRAANSFERFRTLGSEAREEDNLMTRTAAAIALHKE
jgi:tetratricopeptide (TPR) repeat protein